MACANAGTPHSNGSQFFITLDRCDHLDRKHTIFGKITGESIYNAMHLNDLEVSLQSVPYCLLTASCSCALPVPACIMHSAIIWTIKQELLQSCCLYAMQALTLRAYDDVP